MYPGMHGGGGGGGGETGYGNETGSVSIARLGSHPSDPFGVCSQMASKVIAVEI
jgi:hypothetical protein